MSSTRRRESQKSWYHHRGKVRKDEPCEGSGEPPIKITDHGRLAEELGSDHVRGSLPRGICPGCGDELSLNVRTPNKVPVMRKHKNPNAPYRRQILITEEVWRKVEQVAVLTSEDPDEIVDECLAWHLEVPGYITPLRGEASLPLTEDKRVVD